ncbi:MAG TPA: DUF309 domain-containing protein [Candidatus Binatia bacterium]
MPATADPTRELPLAARDAVAGLLLADLAEERPAQSRVAAARRALGLAPGARVDPADVGATAWAALSAAGLIVRDEGVHADGVGPSFVRRDPAWADAVKHKLARYAGALDAAPRGIDLDARLAQARRLLAHELFFEVHEILEPAWRTATGPVRTVLQGLIQAAVAWHHWQTGKLASAARLAGAAREKLAATQEGARDGWDALPPLEVYRSVVAWEAWLLRGAEPPVPPLPFTAERDASARR